MPNKVKTRKEFEEKVSKQGGFPTPAKKRKREGTIEHDGDEACGSAGPLDPGR